MLRGLERPPWWAVVVIVVGLVFLIVGLPLALKRGGETMSKAEIARMNAAAASAEAADEAARPRTVAFVGDSYTGGSAMGGTGDTGWPALVCKELGWQELGARAFGVGGTGYVNPGPDGDQPFGQRIDAVIALKPDIVIIAGGTNDAAFYGLADIRKAAADVFTRLRAGLPDARIVVVGPFYPRAAPKEFLAARDAIFEEASAVGITDTIDPLPWATGPDAFEVGDDQTHPTDRGHQQIAERMTQALRDLGVAPAA